MKKAISLVLALVLALSLAVPARATEEVTNLAAGLEATLDTMTLSTKNTPGIQCLTDGVLASKDGTNQLFFNWLPKEGKSYAIIFDLGYVYAVSGFAFYDAKYITTHCLVSKWAIQGSADGETYTTLYEGTLDKDAVMAASTLEDGKLIANADYTMSQGSFPAGSMARYIRFEVKEISRYKNNAWTVLTDTYGRISEIQIFGFASSAGAVVQNLSDGSYSTTLAGALSALSGEETGETLELLTDVSEAEEDVVLTDNTVLDLNGHDLTLKTLTVVSGKLKDSGTEKAVLTANRYLFTSSTDVLPIYNEEKNGYSFYDVTLVCGKMSSKDKFAMYLDPNSPDFAAAVDLIKKGVEDSRVEAVFWLSYNNGTKDVKVDLHFSKNILEQYLAQAGSKMLAASFTGLDSISGDITVGYEFAVKDAEGTLIGGVTSNKTNVIAK